MKLTDADEVAESLSKAASTVSSNWKNICLASAICLGIYTPIAIYNNRASILPVVYGRLSKGTNTPILTDEWSLIDPITNPKFYICTKKNSCVKDENKAKRVSEILETLGRQTGSEIVVFAIYEENYRQIASQVSSRGVGAIDKGLWIAPTRTSGFDANVSQHKQGLCNKIIVSTLPPDSYVRIAYGTYSISRLYSCPVNEGNPERLMGYVSLSFINEDRPADQEINFYIKRAIEEIELVMGFRKSSLIE